MIFTVKQARQMADMTQEAVASKLGMSIPTYNRYERFPDRMRIITAVQFAQIVNMPIDQIFFGADLPKVDNAQPTKTA